mgnify:CR=1 FL=1
MIRPIPMELLTGITGLRFRRRRSSRVGVTGTEEASVQTEKSLLTHAEQRVAELMCQGLTYKAIADELVVSYHTVKKHVQNIYSKCGINSRYELYKWMEDQAQE